MNLGHDAWDKSEWYYEQLSLFPDGDSTERLGASHYGLNESLPNYERFWKYHIAPASQRPTSIFTRTEADELTSLIAQRSYSVFCSILNSLEQLEVIAEQGLDARNRNAEITLHFAGDALVMFSELERLLAGPTNQFTKSIGFLADRLGVGLHPLSKAEKQNWHKLRENVVAYRHYLTHNGVLFTLTSAESHETMVLKREHIEGMDLVSWKKCEEQHMGNDDDWTPLDKACEQVVADTIALLDLGYESLADEMHSLLTNADYQQLWGWVDGMDVIPNPPPSTHEFEESSASRPSTVLTDVNISPDIPTPSNVRLTESEAAESTPVVIPDVPPSGNRRLE